MRLSAALNLMVWGCFAILAFIYVTEKAHERLEVSNKLHFQFDIPLWPNGETCGDPDDRSVCNECITKPELWDCVGEDRVWGMVFVDNRPGEKRGYNCQRMVKRSELLVAHDTETADFLWPEDWVNSRESDTPTWDGRRVFTDKQAAWTSVIQGDLDKTGAVFDQAVSIFTSTYIDKYNTTNSAWGSHVRLLTAAALATGGDMLEMGTGFFSTPLLHQIVKEQGGARMIISADTDSEWLTLFRNLSTHFHQILLVPVFEDGVNCGAANAQRLNVKPLREMEFAGNITRELTTNRNIVCPVPKDI